MIIIDHKTLNYVVFPDGTADFNSAPKKEITILQWQYEKDKLYELMILFRLLKDSSITQLELTFLPFARQDKPHGFGMLSTFLQLLSFYPSLAVEVLDPHNPSTLPSHWRAVFKLFELSIHSDDLMTTCIVYPDNSAFNKYNELYKDIGCIVRYAEKVRDPETGVICGLRLINSIPTRVNRIIVIDDICDGGKTFIELAQILPPVSALELKVTYGIFSKGLKVLKDAGYSSIETHYNIGEVHE